MIIARVTARSSVFALVAASLLTIAWRAWPAPEMTPPKPTTYRLVPLLAWPIEQAMEDGATSCLPFLQPVLAHPNWQIQILHASGTCFGDEMIDSLAIDSEGRVEWSRPHMPVRYLQLSATELEAIRSLDQRDCRSRSGNGYGFERFRIGFGGDVMAREGALVPQDSPLGEYLQAFFDDLLGRYRARRLAAAGTIDIRLDHPEDGATYHLRIAGQHVIVTHHRHKHLDEEVPIEQLVDVVDWFAAQAPHAVEPDDLFGRGTVTLDGRTRAVVLGSSDVGYGEWLDAMVRNAIYREQHPHDE